jgi:hypothetical protein
VSGIGPTGRERATQRRRGATSSVGSIVSRLVRQPVVGALVAAGVVDAISGSPLSHGALLVAVALGLVVDTVLRRPVHGAASERGAAPAGRAADAAITKGPSVLSVLRPTPGLLLGGVAYAVVVGAFARYSWPVTVAVMAPGLVAIGIAWRTPARERQASIGRVGAAAWATVFLALALWELATLLLQPDLVTMSYAHPTISYLMEPVLAEHAGRSITLFLWLTFGWFLLHR